jgi:PadR family transcriptional regulator PadR
VQVEFGDVPLFTPVSSAGESAMRIDGSGPSPYIYVGYTHIGVQMLTEALKKGSAEFLILSLLQARPRHGYELQKLIESRSRGVLIFNVASLYPLLYGMEEEGWIVGRWVEKTGERRRRFYTLTAAGREALAAQRASWREFVTAINLVAGVRHA